MNIVDLTYNPLKKSSRILINGKTVSPYGEIANFLLEPFTFWSPKILDALSRELNDAFEMKFTSTAIETAIMEKLVQMNENCTSFTAENFAIELDMFDRISKLEELGYSAGQVTKIKIGVFSDDENTLSNIKTSFLNCGFADCIENTVVIRYGHSLEITFVLLLKGVEVDGIQSRCFVSNNKESILSWLNYEERHNIAVLLSETEQFCGTQQETLIFEHKSTNISVLLKNYVEYAFVIPFFANVSKDFLEHYDGDRNSCLVKSLDAVEPIVFVKCDANVIEEGYSCPITVKSFPESSYTPEVIFRISNDGVLQYQNQTLYALKSGNSLVEAYVSGTIEPIYQCNFTVIKRNKISDIQLSTTNYTLGSEDKAEIAYSIVPKNADNVADIQIISENEEIASIESGVIKAKAPGKTTIKMFTSEISKEIDVVVKPYAAGIVLSTDNLKLLVGGSRELLYKTVPNDVINNEISFEVADPRIIDYDGKMVKAKSFGTTTITFYNSDRTIKKQCVVEVKSTLANDKSNPFKALTIVAFVLSLILSGFTKSASISVAAIGFILGIIGIPYAISIAKDQYTNFGTEKKPEFVFCIVGIILNLISIIASL